jgi:hypothetical protein
MDDFEFDDSILPSPPQRPPVTQEDPPVVLSEVQRSDISYTIAALRPPADCDTVPDFPSLCRLLTSHTENISTLPTDLEEKLLAPELLEHFGAAIGQMDDRELVVFLGFISRYSQLSPRLKSVFFECGIISELFQSFLQTETAHFEFLDFFDSVMIACLPAKDHLNAIGFFRHLVNLMQVSPDLLVRVLHSFSVFFAGLPPDFNIIDLTEYLTAICNATSQYDFGVFSDDLRKAFDVEFLSALDAFCCNRSRTRNLIMHGFVPFLLEGLLGMDCSALPSALNLVLKICENGLKSQINDIVTRFPSLLAQRASDFLSRPVCVTTCKIASFLISLDGFSDSNFLSLIFGTYFFDVLRNGTFYEKVAAVDLICAAQRALPGGVGQISGGEEANCGGLD